MYHFKSLTDSLELTHTPLVEDSWPRDIVETPKEAFKVYHYLTPTYLPKRISLRCLPFTQFLINWKIPNPRFPHIASPNQSPLF